MLRCLPIATGKPVRERCRLRQYGFGNMDARQVFGGNPLGVILRLVILSLVVGVVLSAMGITPQNLFYHLDILARRLYELGFGAIDWIIGYMVLGAMVVIPVWLISRAFGLFGAGRKPPRDEHREGSR